MNAKTYRIYIRSEEHPRTINTPAMGRTYYTKIEVDTEEELVITLDQLIRKGEIIYEVRKGVLGFRVKWTEYVVGDTYTIKTKEGVRAFFKKEAFEEAVKSLNGRGITNYTATQNGCPIYTYWMF